MVIIKLYYQILSNHIIKYFIKYISVPYFDYIEYYVIANNNNNNNNNEEYLQNSYFQAILTN